MAVIDIIRAMEKARDSGKRNLLDQEGYDFLMSIGIDAFDYGFELVNDNFMSQPGNNKSFLIAAREIDVPGLMENVAVCKCEGGCGHVLVFRGRIIHPSIAIICGHCRDMMGRKLN